MNELKFLEIIGKIDESLIKEADSAGLRSAEQDISGNTDSVSGVEGYRRSRWSRTAAAAAAFLVIAGAGLGGALLLKRHGAASPDNIEKGETVTAAPTAAEDKNEQAVTETASEKNEPTETVLSTVSVEGTSAADAEENVTAASLETTEQETEQQKASEPATERPVMKVTEPVTSAAIQPEPTTNAEVSVEATDRAQMFARIESLNYTPVTCDGLPDYKLTSDDGKVYWLNFDEGWIWKNGIDAEALLPGDIISWLLANESSINLQKTEYYWEKQGLPDEIEGDGEQPATWIYH
ncbi:MAG: hypothetical protein GXY08_07330 [Ruminococcus sp.]|nr:hypothetical protein [Ruminococcus sp.]